MIGTDPDEHAEVIGDALLIGVETGEPGCLFDRRRIRGDPVLLLVHATCALHVGHWGNKATIETRQNKRKRDQSVKTLRHLESLSADSLQELQRLIADLRPSHLDDLGLSAALRWYAGKIQERADLKVIVEIEGDEALITSALKIAIFRIVQEALNNITKHAEAKEVSIHLEYMATHVHVNIIDDGVGFDMDIVRISRASRPSLA